MAQIDSSELKQSIQEFISTYLNEQTLANLNEMLSNIKTRILETVGTSDCDVAYTTQGGALKLVIVLYNANNCIEDVQTIVTGGFLWNDKFNPMNVGITWEETGVDPRITTAEYGSQSISTTPEMTSEHMDANWYWRCTTTGANLGKRPADVLVDSDLTFVATAPSA